MPRVRPSDRFDQLVRVAARTFIAAGGFHRTQISDIAKALGVAKGTVYLMAESKEALFEAALVHADSASPIKVPTTLPIGTSGAPAATLSERLRTESTFPLLTSALQSESPDDVAAELRAIVGELYDVLARNRVTIKLLTVTAADLPELADVWFGQGRGLLLARLTRYLEQRSEEGSVAPCPTPSISARLILETTSWFAVHRAFDPNPTAMDESAARDEVIRSLSRSFSPRP